MQCSADRPQDGYQGFGGWGYLECSAFFPETVQMVVDEALTAAYTYYRTGGERVRAETSTWSWRELER